MANIPFHPSDIDVVVKFDRVCLNYSGCNDVLNEVSLELTPGSFTFLTGPSGSGKTSFLKLLYLALRPSRGQLSLFGRPTYKLSRKKTVQLRRRIGIVFQEFRLLDHLSVYHNASLPLIVRNEDEGKFRGDVEELLRWVGLGDKLNALPSTLSGGEQQRVAIARALVDRPDLLIADEPTGNVDPDMSRRLIRLFAELNKRLNTTVLIATHDVAMAKRIKADMLKLENGMIHNPSDSKGHQ